MSSDDPYAAGLEVDYNSSWKDLFQKLINFCLSHQISVSTWDENEVAVIEAKGNIIGHISLIEDDASRHDRRHVEITWNALSHFGGGGQQSSRFTFRTSANVIKKGDFVCLLQGASAPTIIRLRSGFSIIVMVAVPLTADLLKQKASITKSGNDFLLVWDWNLSRGEQHDDDYEYFMSNRGAPKCLVAACNCLGALDKAVRSWNFGLLLQRLERYEEAGKRLRSAVEFCRTGTSLRSVEEAYPGHSDWRASDTETLKVLNDLLIEDRGANMETHCIRYGQAPLLWAAEEGYEVLVRRLLQAGATTEDKDRNGRTSLSWAAEMGCETVVCQLLEGGANIEAEDNNERTALSWAAQGGREAVIQRLVDAGAAIETKDASGRTPLSWAATEGDEGAVQRLVDAGAAIETKDASGRTPLSWAATEGAGGAVQRLVDAGAAIETKDASGRTPLSWAATEGAGGAVQRLVDAGAVIEAKNEEGQTPLLYAAGAGHQSVVQILLSTGQVNADSYDVKRRTPLSQAAEYGHAAIVQLLLATGEVNADSKERYRRTPLSYAAKNGHGMVVQLLLATGEVNADSKDKYNQTPLLLAAENGHGTVVQLLLATGEVNVDSEDIYHQTPLFLAAEKGHGEIAQLLEKMTRNKSDT
jgi:ankyrin repeat protein